jgi:hypothetical protein
MDSRVGNPSRLRGSNLLDRHQITPINVAVINGTSPDPVNGIAAVAMPAVT